MEAHERDQEAVMVIHVRDQDFKQGLVSLSQPVPVSLK